MSLNIAMMVSETAKRQSLHTAIIFDDIRMTYRELDVASNRLAHGLASLGLRPGHKVLLMLPNIPEFAVCYYGVLKAGGIVVPCNVQNKAREIEYLLSDSESLIAITSKEYVAELVEGQRGVTTCRWMVVVADKSSASVPQTKGIYPYESLMRSAPADFDMVHTQADDTALIVYTSGTTGKPKGAELSHFSQFYQCRVLPLSTPDMTRPGDVTLCVLPLFHAFGQTCVMGLTFAMGATISLVQRFDPVKVLEAMQRDQVTTFAGVPTMYVQLLNHPDRAKYDLSKLRRCVSGGAPIAVETMAAWKKAYGFDIREGYGLTESAPTATYTEGYVQPKYGRCGKPAWGVEIRIVNDNDETLPVGKEGEVLIRGVNIMKGYYRNPEATAAALKNGWLYTGDIGKLDEEGYLSIVGRKKEMIIRGGYNVYPREIEELLYEHPAVQEAAVIGVPHPELGEEVKAVLYLKAGKQVTPDEIRAYCKEQMAAYKYPRLVEIRSEPLPKGATGKIQKRDLTGK